MSQVTPDKNSGNLLNASGTANAAAFLHLHEPADSSSIRLMRYSERKREIRKLVRRKPRAGCNGLIHQEMLT